MISPEGTFADEDYRWWVQVQFVWRAILDELKLRHPFSLKFLVIFVLFLLVMWAQLFVRGLGLYAGLLTLGIRKGQDRDVLEWLTQEPPPPCPRTPPPRTQIS